MKGIDLVTQMEAEGFRISRRSQSLVWLVRGGDQLLVDTAADLEEKLAQDILAHARVRPTPQP
jgi:hypothetical protein